MNIRSANEVKGMRELNNSVIKQRFTDVREEINELVAKTIEENLTNNNHLPSIKIPIGVYWDLKNGNCAYYYRKDKKDIYVAEFYSIKKGLNEYYKDLIDKLNELGYEVRFNTLIRYGNNGGYISLIVSIPSKPIKESIKEWIIKVYNTIKSDINLFLLR